MANGKPLKTKFTKKKLNALANWKKDEKAPSTPSASIFGDSDEFGADDRDNILLKKLNKGQQISIQDEGHHLSLLITPGNIRKPTPTLTLRASFYLKAAPGSEMRMSIGRWGEKKYSKEGELILDCGNLAAVRDEAVKVNSIARQGGDPRKPRRSPNDSFMARVGEYIKDYAKEEVITWKETERILNVYCIPEWQNLGMSELSGNSDEFTSLIEKIRKGQIKQNGKKLGTPYMAGAVRTQLSAFFNWYIDEKNSAFVSPVTQSRKKRGQKAKQDNKQSARALKPPPRTRVLSATEIQIMWPILGELGAYGAAIKIALLIPSRIGTIFSMRRSELSDRIYVPERMIGNTVLPERMIKGAFWDPTSDRDPDNKLKSVIPLSAWAHEIINSVKIIKAGEESQDWVFSDDGINPIDVDSSSRKKRLDRLMKKALAEAGKQSEWPEKYVFRPWQKRDLRRTVRSRLSATGADSRTSEHALGHVQSSIEATYDRYAYLEEKQEVLERLSRLVRSIVESPSGDNIITLPRGRKAE